MPALEAAPTLEIGSTDTTAPGVPVTTVGYPHTDTGRLVLTQQSGAVGARVFLGKPPMKIKHIVLNMQTRPGQSGSPVVAGNHVIAVVTGAYRPAGGGGVIVAGIDPATLHQTTHAVSAEYLRTML